MSSVQDTLLLGQLNEKVFESTLQAGEGVQGERPSTVKHKDGKGQAVGAEEAGAVASSCFRPSRRRARARRGCGLRANWPKGSGGGAGSSPKAVQGAFSILSFRVCPPHFVRVKRTIICT